MKPSGSKSAVEPCLVKLKGFDVLFSSTHNRSFKQTNFLFSCASSCPSYLKRSYYEINMWSTPRSWLSSVASRPAGRPQGGQGQGGAEGEEDGRDVWLREDSKGILNPGGDCKLDSNHWTVGFTVVMGLELQERSSSTHFFLYLKLTLKKIQNMY